MIGHWRRYRTLFLLGSSLIGGCGASLPAVQATSAAGQRLSPDDRVLAALPALCLEVASLSGASDDCSRVRDQARAWTYVVAQIEAYAQALSLHASQAESISAEMLPGGTSACGTSMPTALMNGAMRWVMSMAGFLR